MDPPEEEYKSITTPPPVELHITLLECMGIFIKAIPHLFPHSKKAVCFLGIYNLVRCWLMFALIVLDLDIIPANDPDRGFGNSCWYSSKNTKIA